MCFLVVVFSSIPISTILIVWFFLKHSHFFWRPIVFFTLFLFSVFNKITPSAIRFKVNGNVCQWSYVCPNILQFWFVYCKSKKFNNELFFQRYSFCYWSRSLCPACLLSWRAYICICHRTIAYHVNSFRSTFFRYFSVAIRDSDFELSNKRGEKKSNSFVILCNFPFFFLILPISIYVSRYNYNLWLVCMCTTLFIWEREREEKTELFCNYFSRDGIMRNISQKKSCK